MRRFALIGFLDHLRIVFLECFQLFSEIGDDSLINIDLLGQKIGLLIVDFDQITSNRYFNIEVFYLRKQGLFLSGVIKKKAVDLLDLCLKPLFLVFQRFLTSRIGLGHTQGCREKKKNYTELSYAIHHISIGW